MFEQRARAVDNGSVWFTELMWKAYAALDRIVPANPVLRWGGAFFSIWTVVGVVAYTSPTTSSRTSRTGLQVNHAHGHFLAATLVSLAVTVFCFFISLMLLAIRSGRDS
jgi:hypothetical protein